MIATTASIILLTWIDAKDKAHNANLCHAMAEIACQFPSQNECIETFNNVSSLDPTLKRWLIEHNAHVTKDNRPDFFLFACTLYETVY